MNIGVLPMIVKKHVWTLREGPFELRAGTAYNQVHACRHRVTKASGGCEPPDSFPDIAAGL